MFGRRFFRLGQGFPRQDFFKFPKRSLFYVASPAFLNVAAKVVGAATTTGLAAAAAGYYAGYDPQKFRNMVSMNAPKGQERFTNLQDFVHLVKEVEKRTPSSHLDEPTLQRCSRMAELLKNFNTKFVGMAHVKQFLLEQCTTGLLQLNLREDKSPAESMNHFTIVGPSGVGKTELAREIGPLYYEIGLTGENKITVYQGKDLIAGFVGGTGSLAFDALEKAKNGFIFIDEAHHLKNAYWPDFLQVFLQFLTANPLTVVVLAGYEKEINELLDSDPGLKRRFQSQIKLKGYQAEELAKIFTNMMEKDGFYLDDAVVRTLPTYLAKNMNLFPQYAGDVQVFVKACKVAHGSNSTHFPSQPLRHITLKDFEDGGKKYAAEKKESPPGKWW